MLSTISIFALCGFTLAAPKPQAINVAAIDALPRPYVLGPDIEALFATLPTYNPTAAASAAAADVIAHPITVGKRDIFEKRAACVQEPYGNGPVPGNGSVEAYLDPNNNLSMTAQGADTPSGYVESFTNLQAGTQQDGYLTFMTLSGETYDVDSCASFCNSTQYCLGFNIYYERDPNVDPAAGCPNPAPVTNIKCALFGYAVSGETATNKGQYRGPPDANGTAFQVVIVGSDGYFREGSSPSPGPLTNFTGPAGPLPGAIFVDPAQGTYLGDKLYNNGPFDPSQCAAACQAQTAMDRATPNSDGTYKPCNFFNSYILTKNGAPQGTYCAFYTQAYGESYATNTGYDYEGDQYRVTSSYTYTLTTPDPGHV